MDTQLFSNQSSLCIPCVCTSATNNNKIHHTSLPNNTINSTNIIKAVAPSCKLIIAFTKSDLMIDTELLIAEWMSLLLIPKFMESIIILVGSNNITNNIRNNTSQVNICEYNTLAYTIYQWLILENTDMI